MRIKTAITLLAVITATVLAACKKYDEGPMLSLRSKTKRLDGEWNIDRFKENGVDVTSQMQPWTNTVTFDKPDFFLRFVSNDGSGHFDEYIGVWEFSSDKEALNMIYHTNRYDFGSGIQTDPRSETEQWTIHRLTSKELKVEYFSLGTKYELECTKR